MNPDTYQMPPDLSTQTWFNIFLLLVILAGIFWLKRERDKHK